MRLLQVEKRIVNLLTVLPIVRSVRLVVNNLTSCQPRNLVHSLLVCGVRGFPFRRRHCIPFLRFVFCLAYEIVRNLVRDDILPTVIEISALRCSTDNPCDRRFTRSACSACTACTCSADRTAYVSVSAVCIACIIRRSTIRKTEYIVKIRAVRSTPYAIVSSGQINAVEVFYLLCNVYRLIAQLLLSRIIRFVPCIAFSEHQLTGCNNTLVFVNVIVCGIHRAVLTCRVYRDIVRAGRSYRFFYRLCCHNITFTLPFEISPFFLHILKEYL